MRLYFYSLVLIYQINLFGGSAVDAIPSSHTSELAEATLLKRQEDLEKGIAHVFEANQLVADNKLQEARTLYSSALERITLSPATQNLYTQASDGFAKTSISLALQNANAAEYQKSLELLTSIEGTQYEKWHSVKSRLQKRINDSGYYNPSLTPEHLANTKEVVRLLQLATGQRDLGNYDLSTETYQSVLRIDPSNSAAQRGLEDIEKLRSESYDSGRMQMRARALGMVDSNWVPNVPALAKNSTPSTTGSINTNEDFDTEITNELKTTIIPRIEFSEITVEDAISFLNSKVRENNPETKLNIYSMKVDPNITFDLTLESTPLAEVISYVARKAKLKISYTSVGVELLPANSDSDELLSRSWGVPPNFIQALPVDNEDNPFEENEADSITKRITAKEYLENQGITFPDGASAYWDRSTNQLTVKNTLDTLDYVDELVESSKNDAPQQIQVLVKIIDVRQNNLKELGLDWLLGQFNIGGDKVFGSGGVAGNTQAPTSADFPVTLPSGVPVGLNPITNGNRGFEALRENLSVDEVIGGLTNTSQINTRSPGVFALSGVFTDPQFQTVARALDQGKGIDTVAAPSITTRSGQIATVEVVREFPYPTEFEPPELPEGIGVINDNDDDDDDDGDGGFPPNPNNPTNALTVPITPTTPTAFEVRKTGMRLQVEATLSQETKLIELQVSPEIVRFDGFINYGTPINITTTAGGNPIQTQVTPNAIFQPIFSTQRSTTNVSIYDGSTILMAGIIYDKQSDLEDQHPLFGKVPGAGKLFEADAKISTKRNLLIFVTARLIDPSGTAIQSRSLN